MTTIRRCPVCRQTVSSEDCTRCPECSAALEPERPVAEAVQDILKNVKQQIDPLDVDLDEPEEIDRDIAAILSGSDFQEILEESLREEGDVRGPVPGKPPADQTAFPAGSAAAPAGPERSSPFGTALGSLKHKHADPAEADASVGQTPGGSDTWDGYSFLLDDGPDPGALDTPSASVAPSPRRWWGFTRQTLYLLLLLLVCLFLFRLFGPREKKYDVEDFFQPGNSDIDFLAAINYLEKYYEQHPELKRGQVLQQADEGLLEPAGRPLSGGDAGKDAPASTESTP